MRAKNLAIAAVPLMSLCLASYAGATMRSLKAFMTADGVANQKVVYDCTLVSMRGIRAHIQSESKGLDSCGNWCINPVTARVATSSTGVTAVQQLDDQMSHAACGNVVQHRARIQSHLIDGVTGEEVLLDRGSPGPNSGCWDSNVNTGMCTSATPPVTLSSSLTETGGSCQNRVFHGTSAGTTP